MRISGLNSNLSEEIIRQNNLFDIEQKKQKEAIGRIEKIEVKYEGPSETATLVMNKHISTPYDCARRTVITYLVLF